MYLVPFLTWFDCSINVTSHGFACLHMYVCMYTVYMYVYVYARMDSYCSLDKLRLQGSVSCQRREIKSLFMQCYYGVSLLSQSWSTL